MFNWLFSNDVQVEQLTWARPISLTAMVLAFGAIVVLTVFLYKRLRGAPPMIRLALGDGEDGCAVLDRCYFT